MKKLIMFVVIILCGISLMAEQKVYKIKPIKGGKSALVQSYDLGTGMTKWTISLERLSGKISEIYLPSDAVIYIEGNGYNPPPSSKSVKINSSKTADGFLFNGNGPNNNNIQIHLKKSSSENSYYTLSVNLRQGEKYEFPIYYLPGNYLMVKSIASDYENMISAISNNQYFMESLTFVDEEIAKYQEEPNLIWWAEALVGIFQDFVDVETIGQILPEIHFDVFTFHSEADDPTLVEWVCNGSSFSEVITKGEILLVTSEGDCATAAIPVILGSWTYCSEIMCPLGDFSIGPEGYAEWLDCINRCLWHYGNDIIPGGFRIDCYTLCDLDYEACIEGGVSPDICSNEHAACNATCNLQR